MAGAAQTVAVACLSHDQQPLQGQVQFIPLRGEKEEVLLVLALLDDGIGPADHGEDSAASGALHTRIQRLRQQWRERYQINHLLGDTPAMARARQQAELAARTQAAVLVVGPEGSGREYLARAIHYCQATASEPLVPLACPLVGAELLSSTITALARNAPSSPAGKATLLLNNVELLRAPLQAALATQLAAARQRVRIISTARTSLVSLAETKRFDVSLAHLLSTLTIELPPLSQRLEDLPLLAQLFLEECNARGAKQVGRFAEEALDLLAGHPWHGNLDELDQIVRQAHERCQTAEVSADDLPPAIRHSHDAAAYPRLPAETIVLEEFLGSIERELIERALEQAKGNKSKAAQLLGMTRPKLYRRLVQLGLIEAEPSARSPALANEMADADETVDSAAFEIEDDEIFSSE
jgi:DNA-binding NtrC family response regulator